MDAEYSTLDVFENQRWYPGGSGWSSSLLFTDRPRFSNREGTQKATLVQVPPSAEWEFVSGWKLDTRGDTLPDGWAYGFNFDGVGRRWRKERFGDFVRWRRWFRLMRRDKSSASPIGRRCLRCYTPGNVDRTTCLNCGHTLTSELVSVEPVGDEDTPKFTFDQINDTRDEEPLYLCCPITFEVFEDPVLSPHGHTFERAAIVDHLSHSPECPLTRKPLSVASLIPNRAMRTAAQAWRDYVLTGVGGAGVHAALVPGVPPGASAVPTSLTCTLCSHVNDAGADLCTMCLTGLDRRAVGTGAGTGAGAGAGVGAGAGLSGLAPAPPPLGRQLSDKGQALLRSTFDERDIQGLPSFLLCPLSSREVPVLFTDPVVTPDGYTYERGLLEAHLEVSSLEPITDRPLSISAVVPNRALRSCAEAFHKSLTVKLGD